MSSTFGKNVTLTVSGRSRGEKLTAILDGIPAGIAVDGELIARRLSLRRPDGVLSTSRIEPDGFEITAGVFGGFTDGTPICISIGNSDCGDGDQPEYFRPSHADFTSFVKYGGFADMRGGGFFSGRLTSLLVAAGAIAESVLCDRFPGVSAATRIKSVGCVTDPSDVSDRKTHGELKNASFPVVSPEIAEEMKREMLRVKEEGDSLGGTLETVILGLPAGVGEPYFDSLESVISHAVFSIPGVKGISFGDGFALSAMKGSEANDPILSAENVLLTASNRAGGINGGISNGMPVVFTTAFRPTPTIALPQTTVSKSDPAKPGSVAFGGRNDPCFAIRAPQAVTAVTELALLDLLVSGRFLR